MHAYAHAVCATVCINTQYTAHVLYTGLQHGILYHTEALYTVLYAVLCVHEYCITCSVCACVQHHMSCVQIQMLCTTHTMYCRGIQRDTVYPTYPLCSTVWSTNTRYACISCNMRCRVWSHVCTQTHILPLHVLQHATVCPLEGDVVQYTAVHTVGVHSIHHCMNTCPYTYPVITTTGYSLTTPQRDVVDGILWDMLSPMISLWGGCRPTTPHLCR